MLSLVRFNFIIYLRGLYDFIYNTYYGMMTFFLSFIQISILNLTTDKPNGYLSSRFCITVRQSRTA